MGVCGEVVSLVIYLQQREWGPGDDSDRHATGAWGVRGIVHKTVLCIRVYRTCHPKLPGWNLFFILSWLRVTRDEGAITAAHSGGQWRGAEVEPDRGAGPGDTMLRLPQNGKGAQEGKRGLRVPQNLWELPTQWSLWDQVRLLTTNLHRNNNSQ